MKALLDFHGFTKFIDMPEIRDSWSVPIRNPIRMSTSEDHQVPINQKMTFRFIKTYNIGSETVALYQSEDTIKVL